jgi:SAM-dependent methyltransferase
VKGEPVDPARYDRARPRYPVAMVERIVTASPGRAVLDVGCGTGIAARQFQAAGCTVLGVEPDARMAGWARRSGLEVDVSTFEDWDPAGRRFDAVVAGMTWHWVDPVAGAARAAQVLRPGGRLALFWYVFRPTSGLADTFSAVYERALPDTPIAEGPDLQPRRVAGLPAHRGRAPPVSACGTGRADGGDRRCRRRGRRQLSDALHRRGGHSGAPLSAASTSRSESSRSRRRASASLACGLGSTGSGVLLSK